MQLPTVFFKVYLSTALQAFVGPCPLFQFLDLFTHSIGLLGQGDQPVARPLPAHRTAHKQRINTHRHPCLEWDSNPLSQLSGHCDRLFKVYRVYLQI
jgi:hypothetical protein